jgi:DNA invertase Pin-like site-specific DNA recombinase
MAPYDWAPAEQKVVYKVDRLTRSLADLAKLVELFDTHQVSFFSVTQAFNTTNRSLREQTERSIR